MSSGQPVVATDYLVTQQFANQPFCDQCKQQTEQEYGCSIANNCSKQVTTSKLQNLLIYALQGVAMYYGPARKLGIANHELDHLILDGLFTAVSNVNFDDSRLIQLLQKIVVAKEQAKKLYHSVITQHKQYADALNGPALYELGSSKEAILQQADLINISQRQKLFGSEIVGLQELLSYGLKGMAAYAHHAQLLGKEADEVYEYLVDALAFLAQETITIEALLAYNLKCGELNLKVMELLDAANTASFGIPEITQVRITPIPGKAILVSGHDLQDLELLLRQTEGLGINIYTHGEMLPALAYPKLRYYPHLVGNYGGGWGDQQQEFANFPGAILMTTNCLQAPQGYEARMFTSGLVGWPGVQHIADHNYQPVIEAALAAEGFVTASPAQYLTIGFAYQSVLKLAPKIISAVLAGRIKHLFLVGSCDSAKPGKNYYTELAQVIPNDCIIFTLACCKYRFNKLNFGEIDGIPRLLDIGQCNDAYSAIQIILALATALKTAVNDLPFSLILSWYEPKAVCILLTLLHLGIRNIRLGPTLPNFITPAILELLVKKFNIQLITTAVADLQNILHK